MWPFRRTKDVEPTAEPVRNGSDDGAERRDERHGELKRRAGCLWSVLTEPLAILVVTLLAVVFGRAYLARRADHLRKQKDAESGGSDDV